MSLTEHLFAEVAGRQMAAPIKAKHRLAERRAKRAATPAEAAVRERTKALRLYRKATRHIWRTALVGPHGRDLSDLNRALRRFGPEDAAALVAHIEALDWIAGADTDTRHLAFRLAAGRIQRIRESLGLAPFDDALPGEPDCAVVRCHKAILGGRHG